MSVEAISMVLNHSRARGVAKLVLIGIANHDGDGGAWPAIGTLARYANTSERTVQRAINDLVELGELVVHSQQGGTLHTRADRRTNRYEILVRPVDNSNSGVTTVSPREGDGVTVLTPRGDNVVANGVTTVSPEPSLEPSFNHGESTYETTSSDPAPVDNFPSQDVLDLGAPAADAAAEEPFVVSPMCPAHQNVFNPPPCGACARQREAFEAQQVRARRLSAKADRERERREMRERERRAARLRADPEVQAANEKAKAKIRAALGRKVSVS